MEIKVEFSGGLEILFGNIRIHNIKLENESANIKDLIQYLRENLMTDSRVEMFLQDGLVRPGILVLINDADWELEGQEEYVLQDHDSIIFASTLHGG